MGGNPILEMDKGEMSPFPCIRGPLPLGLWKKVGEALIALSQIFFGRNVWDNRPLIGGPTCL